MAQIMYAARTADRGMLERIFAVLDRNAEAAADCSHCTVKRHWVSKSRPGLANHAMAEITFRNLERAGPPRFGEDAIAVARAIQKELGLTPMDRPFADEIEQLISPQDAEAQVRAHHSRLADALYVGRLYRHDLACADRALLYRPRDAEGAARAAYPDWVDERAGRHPGRPSIRLIATAAKVVSSTILDLLSDGDTMRTATAEFHRRREEGGDLKPWCDYDPPIHFPWPEYIETPRGREWWIPASPEDRALAR